MTFMQCYFSTINSLQTAGKFNIKGKDVFVEFYLGGDYRITLATMNNWSRSLMSFFQKLKYNNLTIYFIVIYFSKCSTVLHFLFSSSLLVLGMKGATSDYACVWCKIYKSERWVTLFSIITTYCIFKIWVIRTYFYYMGYFKTTWLVGKWKKSINQWHSRLRFKKTVFLPVPITAEC